MNRFTTIDLFAGAGGLSVAAQAVGFRVMAALENNRHACSTYRENLVKRKQRRLRPEVFEEDALAIKPSTMLERVDIQKGDLDLLMGGPPCQGYSRHRYRNSGVMDPRNSLLIRYFAFVREFFPKVFLVENVPGLLWDRHRRYLVSFRRETTRAGYELIGPEALNARDFGVPQNRKRIFMVGVRKDLRLDFDWPKPTHFDPNSREVRVGNKRAWVTAGSVFYSHHSDDVNNVYMNPSEEMVRVFKSTPINGGSRKDSCRILPCHKNHNGHKDPYGRIDPSKPGPTMTTACINPSKGRFVHPTKNHGITVREAARFQGFSDSFRFEGGLIAGGMQIGNAVPIPLGKKILREISKSLKDAG